MRGGRVFDGKHLKMLQDALGVAFGRRRKHTGREELKP
jgi:hypothetical protein